MQVSVETLNGLERKVTISVPTEKVEEEVELRLKNLARKVKVDGFRPGKVPLHVVKTRFSNSVRQEVARDMVQPTLYEALKEKALIPAGTPYIEPNLVERGQDFCYTAVFEVYPEIQVNELEKTTVVELVESKVTDSDVDTMLMKLREQHKTWQEVSRNVSMGDKVVVDFEGFIEETPFEGGKATDYSIVIGEGKMIPGFESGLVNAVKNEPFDLRITFPEEYGHDKLAGKEALFKITVKAVMEPQVPPLDDALAEQFNIKEGGVDALTKDIRQNMERELDRRVNAMNRERVFNALLKVNAFELPMTMIEQEIGHLKHEMYHRVFGHEHHENEKIPDFPRALFEEQARRRVHLGLLFSEYVKKHKMTVDKVHVDAMIEKLASAYESPDELRDWYNQSKERMADIEALVMEELVSEKILEGVTREKTIMDYEAVMNPKQDPQDKGA